MLCMMAVVWHWWMAPIMAISLVGLLLATVGLYLFLVVKPKYPPKNK